MYRAVTHFAFETIDQMLPPSEMQNLQNFHVPVGQTLPKIATDAVSRV